MCSELFRIPYTWGGVPIFGVGVLLAIWAIVAAITLVGLIRQHGWSAETLSSLPVLLLLGAAILFLPRVFPEGLPIRGYGVMLLVGITAGVGLAMHRARQGGLDPEIIISLAIWMVVCGVVGARLFYVIEYWHESFAGRNLRDTILQIATLPEGGLVIFGGFHRRHGRVRDARAQTTVAAVGHGRLDRSEHGDRPGVWPHRLLSQWLLLRRSNCPALACFISRIQFSLRIKDRTTPAVQPAVCRSGVARRDAWLSPRSRRFRCSGRDARRRWFAMPRRPA